MDDKVTPFPRTRKPKGRNGRATPIADGNVHVLKPHRHGGTTRAA